ncbi:RNA-directed DNA polymerase, eukaryota, reverse transcriptase zinc-binding domain protein [Tanacetum coccineum]
MMGSCTKPSNEMISYTIRVGRSGTLVRQGSAYNRDLRTWTCLVDFRCPVEVFSGSLPSVLLPPDYSQDTWNWELDDDGEFSVKRLPVMVELDKKGIDLHSLLCPACDNACESIDHGIVLCSEVMKVWSLVFGWWHLGNVNAFTAYDMLNHNGGGGMSSKNIALWQAVVRLHLKETSKGSGFNIRYWKSWLAVLEAGSVGFPARASDYTQKRKSTVVPKFKKLFEENNIKKAAAAAEACKTYDEAKAGQ